MTLALFATFIACSGFAQTIQRRGRIENVTDYSVFAKTPTGGARRVGLRSSAPLPCFGSPKIPVVLVQFADQKFLDYDKDGVVRKRYDDYFNLKQGNAGNSLGSVYQYFKEQSYGQFTPEFDIIGPITLSREYAYYGEDWYNGKKLVQRDVNINEFYREVCHNVVTNENKDWSSFDNNHDGAVDMIFFIYAGEGENAFHVDDEDESKIQYDKRDLIWPKESGNTEVFADITFGSYGMTNELYHGAVDGIGTCVHELSHGLGLPDLYDTSGGYGLGVDAWDVMDGGNYQIGGCAPIGYSAYERDFMGWRSIETIKKDEVVTLTIKPLETDGVAYKIANPANTNEYFILENRQNIGYDEYMPWQNTSTYKAKGGQHGLLITHVDYDKSSWTGNKVNANVNHQRYSIVPADGEHLSFLDATDENYPIFVESYMGDFYPGAKGVKAISSYKTFTGGTLNQTIDNIREVDGVIYVDINGGTVIPELQAQLATDIETAKSYVGKKMGSSVAKKLNTAITNAENVARDQDAIETVSAALAKAVKNAKNSINLYKKIAAVIAKAAELGEVGKASFEAAGIQKGYDEGTLTSIDPVNQAYDDAVAAQTEADAVVELKATLANDVTTAKTYVGKKMDKNVATALNNAITAAENVGNTRDAVNTASANLATAVTDATASIELYKKVAEYIAKVDALGEAAKASFIGVRKAYDDGTITSLADVEAAYAEAVKAQEEANGIGDVTVDAKSQQIYTVEGKTAKTIGRGINIVKDAKGKAVKVIKK